MKRIDSQARALRNMRRTTETLSEMVAGAVTEVRYLQKAQEKARGHRAASRDELAECYDTKTIRELTAILKDIAAVARALQENGEAQEKGTLGVVLLPPVMLPQETTEEITEEERPTVAAEQGEEVEMLGKR